MRELEFLPAWYPQARSRRRLVLLQVWATLALAAALGLWAVMAQHRIQRAQAFEADLRNKLAQSHEDLRQMEDLVRQRKQLRQAEQIMSKLGVQIEATRLIRAVDDVMPREVTLVNLEVNTEESAEGAPQARLAGPEGAVDRHLHVRFQGLAPASVDLSAFIAQLGAQPFFEQVAITYVKERSESNNNLREG